MVLVVCLPKYIQSFTFLCASRVFIRFKALVSPIAPAFRDPSFSVELLYQNVVG